MNKKFLYVLPISLLLAACVHQEKGQDNHPGIKLTTCNTVIIPHDCGNGNGNGSPENPVVQVNLQGKLGAHPPNVCARTGSTLIIKLHPDPGIIETVATIPKNPEQLWLVKSNSPDSSQIVINIPEGEGDHDYTILTADGKCLDPRVNVRR